MNLARLSDEPFTYTEIGATAGRLPDGYHHVSKSARIGTGRARFEEAAARVMTWGMLRGAGVRPRRQHARSRRPVRWWSWASDR